MLQSDPEALRNLRQTKGHSTRTLAGVAGITHATISRLESGSVAVFPATAKRIADALGVEITDIATFVPDDKAATA